MEPEIDFFAKKLYLLWSLFQERDGVFLRNIGRYLLNNSVQIVFVRKTIRKSVIWKYPPPKKKKKKN